MTDVYDALPVPIQVAIAVVAAVAVGMGVLLTMHWFVGLTRSNARRATPPSGDAPRLRARMRRLVRPTLLLVPSTEAGASKLGGDPDLPNGVAWPQVRGRPRAFVAQIELAAAQQVAPLDWLPAVGMLQAFVDLEGHGFADQVQVLFHPSLPGEGPTAPARAVQFPERRVAFKRFASLPSLDWLGVDLAEADLSDDELDDLSGLPSAPEGTEITPAILRASKAWRLLLQIDSDPGLEMNWGDGGRLYVFVREQDSRAGDFSRTVTLSQSY